MTNQLDNTFTVQGKNMMGLHYMYETSGKMAEIKTYRNIGNRAGERQTNKTNMLDCWPLKNCI